MDGCWLSRGEDVTVCLICKSNRQRKTCDTLTRHLASVGQSLPVVLYHCPVWGARTDRRSLRPAATVPSQPPPCHLEAFARCHYRKVMQMQTRQACSFQLVPVGKSGCSSRLALSEAPVLATHGGGIKVPRMRAPSAGREQDLGICDPLNHSPVPRSPSTRLACPQKTGPI